MPVLAKIKSTFRSLLRKKELDQDLGEELESYLDMLAQEKIDKGMEAELKLAAKRRLELGGVEQVKERVRENRLGAAIDTLLHDIRFTFRTLWKNKGFALCRDSDSRHRHRRQYGPFQHHQHGPSTTSSLRGSRPVDHRPQNH